MLSNIAYRQKTYKIISLTVYNPKNIDKMIGQNLKRLRVQRKLTQAQLGDLIEVDGNVIAQLEGAIIGMGKDIMARLCNALKVEPAEFYRKEDTPIIADEQEMQIIQAMRKYPDIKPEMAIIAESLAHYKGKSGQAATVQKKKTRGRRTA